MAKMAQNKSKRKIDKLDEKIKYTEWILTRSQKDLFLLKKKKQKLIEKFNKINEINKNTKEKNNEMKQTNESEITITKVKRIVKENITRIDDNIAMKKNTKKDIIVEQDNKINEDKTDTHHFDGLCHIHGHQWVSSLGYDYCPKCSAERIQF